MDTSDMMHTRSKRKATSNASEVLSKRPRKNDQEPEGTVHYVHRLLRDIQNDAGHPITTAMLGYNHSTILQLPFQPGILTRDNLYCHYQPALWTTTYPIPLITHCSQSASVNAVDPLLRLLKDKKSHLSTLSSMKLYYAKKKAAYKKACKGLEKKLYPNMVYKVAEEMERDPDRWFRGTAGYDYYFTGGSLAVVTRGESRWIVNTVGENMNAVEMVRFDVEGNRGTVDSSQMERIELCEEDGPICEICWLEGENESEDDSKVDLKIAFRRKRKIEVLEEKDGEISSENIKSLSSEVPFISFCFLRSNFGSLICTSDLEKKLKIWDYDSGEIIHEIKLAKKGRQDDCWTCVRPFGKKYIACLDRNYIKLFKIKVELTLVHQSLLSMWTWSCEKASCLEVCAESMLLFVGTSHKLIILQLVYQDATPEFQQILTFTHNLKFSPTMIRYSSNSDQNFYVWLSSHLPGDTTICNFSKVPPKRYATNNLPQKPWTAQEAFHLAHLEGKCLYPAAKLKRRLQLFHSGIALLVDDDHHFHMLLQNSYGDVFYQQITSLPNATNAEEMPAIYHALMLKLNRETPSTPKVTDFKNLRGFKKIITCAHLDRPPIATADPTQEIPFKRRPRWRQTVEELHKYKDLLAPDMLQVWGFRPDVSREQRRRLSRDEPMNVEDRISNWLDTTVADDVTIVRDKDAIAAAAVAAAGDVVHIESDHEDVLHSIVEIGEEIKPELDQVAPPVEPDVVFVRTVVADASKSGPAKPTVKQGRRKYVKGF